ncbi:ABC transporter permease, partial [Escherichia marmotae]|uniref:hypothetical protein n=1 Tax=Escherichia marmotae TaxID=1499973 RepID=UPI00183D68DF
AATLIVRPQGLMGRREAPRGGRVVHAVPPPLTPFTPSQRGLVAAGIAALAAAPWLVDGYFLGVLSEILIFALVTAGLQFLTGLGGMISFGHA